MADRDRTGGSPFTPEDPDEVPVVARVISMRTGKVIAKGKIQELSIKAGDHSLIGNGSGSGVTRRDEHVVPREDDALAIEE